MSSILDVWKGSEFASDSVTTSSLHYFFRYLLLSATSYTTSYTTHPLATMWR